MSREELKDKLRKMMSFKDYFSDDEVEAYVRVCEHYHKEKNLDIVRKIEEKVRYPFEKSMLFGLTKEQRLEVIDKYSKLEPLSAEDDMRNTIYAEAITLIKEP
jgi:hypothetical protein